MALKLLYDIHAKIVKENNTSNSTSSLEHILVNIIICRTYPLSYGKRIQLRILPTN